MSSHYSKFELNTYAWTRYFEAQVPDDYPFYLVLQKCRAFRRLPPNLRTLAGLSKQWAERMYPDVPGGNMGITQYYDDAGNELDPVSGQKLADAEIDANWLPDPSLDTFVVSDISPGPFGDPDTWEPPAVKEAPPHRPEKVQLLNDIVSRGRKAAEDEYGLTDDQLPIGPFTYEGMDFDEAKAHFAKRVENVLNSPYFSAFPERQTQRDTLVHVLRNVDLYDDLWGDAEDIFDRAEAAFVLEESS